MTRAKIFLMSLALLLGAAAHASDKDKLRELKTKLKPLQSMSEPDEIAFGRDVAANLLGAAPLVKDPGLQSYVNKLGRWIALQSERPNLPWRFGVLDTDSINAFAAPGGYVFVTHGLLRRCRDEAELAGILAHEISHVVERHALKTLRKGSVAELVGQALARDKPEYAKLVNAGTEIYARGLDKEDEYAADRAGVVLAARAGYDPYGLPAVLQTLASINPADDAVSLMFKTHPNPETRLNLVINSMDRPLAKYSSNPRVEKRFISEIKSHK